MALHALSDHTVGQIRIIFQPITANGTRVDGSDYLVYAQRFDSVRSSGLCEPASGLFRLKRAESNRQNTPRRRLGAVVEANRIRCGVHVAPYFGATAHREYTKKTYAEVSTLFNLNKYSDKETFELLRDEF